LYFELFLLLGSISAQDSCLSASEVEKLGLSLLTATTATVVVFISLRPALAVPDYIRGALSLYTASIVGPGVVGESGR